MGRIVLAWTRRFPQAGTISWCPRGDARKGPEGNDFDCWAHEQDWMPGRPPYSM